MWFWPGQAQNQVDSLIPLLYIAHDHDLQAAVDDVTEILRNAVARFGIARRNRPIWGYRWWVDRDCWRGQVHGQLPICLHRESQLEVSGKLMLYPRLIHALRHRTRILEYSITRVPGPRPSRFKNTGGPFYVTPIQILSGSPTVEELPLSTKRT